MDSICLNSHELRPRNAICTSVGNIYLLETRNLTLDNVRGFGTYAAGHREAPGKCITQTRGEDLQKKQNLQHD